ncbi:MAG: hypothetical protein HUK20_12455 [Fibrobacter sp.]|nr:hypothetical protein [Fibrobacter sp.]
MRKGLTWLICKSPHLENHTNALDSIVATLLQNDSHECHPGVKHSATITPQGERRGQACLSMTETLAELSEGQLGS